MTRLNLGKIAGRLQWLKDCGQDEAEKLLGTSRYRESLCFLQAMSHQPGGLEKFAEKFLASEKEWAGQLPAGRGFCFEQYLRGVSRGSEACSRAEELAWYLQRWCEEPFPEEFEDVLFPNFDKRYPGFLKALCRFMDRYAEAELAKTAATSLRQKVIEELEFVRQSAPTIPMMFVADTRHGKTTACETYCRAWPGRTRLVTIPESDSESEFYGTYAEAFNMEVLPRSKKEMLKARVQFVLRNTGLFILHDEFHYAVPVKYERDTPPQRLNFIRAQIIDRHIPCAFFATRQTERETLVRYAAKTHHNLEQWIGRMPKPFLIVEKPRQADLMAVARNRFPEFPQVVLDELCDGAMEKRDSAGGNFTGESGFKIVELAGARARYLATKQGRKAVSLAEMREAIVWAGGNPLPEAIRHAAPPVRVPRDNGSALPQRLVWNRSGVREVAPATVNGPKVLASV